LIEKNIRKILKSIWWRVAFVQDTLKESRQLAAFGSKVKLAQDILPL
jgi:hypothetical protein